MSTVLRHCELTKILARQSATVSSCATYLKSMFYPTREPNVFCFVFFLLESFTKVEKCNNTFVSLIVVEEAQLQNAPNFQKKLFVTYGSRRGTN